LYLIRFGPNSTSNNAENCAPNILFVFSQIVFFKLNIIIKTAA